MWRPYSLPFVASFAVVVLLLAACSGSSDEAADTTLAPTTTDQATTTTPASTTTAATTTTASTTTTTQALPEEEVPGPGEQWDLVWISDSIGEGVAEAWADRIEESEGVEVRVHNYVRGFLTVEEAQYMITNATGIREEVADAEIIVVYGNSANTPLPSDDMATSCVRAGTDPREPPKRYTSADFAPYGDVFRDIFDVVFELCSGQPTVIRTFDLFSGMIVDWREAGIEPECTAAWEAQADAIHEAADEYSVLTASFYDEFNGVDHDEDPRERGYIAADGFHQSQDAGVAAQVAVLHALGYDPTIP